MPLSILLLALLLGPALWRLLTVATVLRQAHGLARVSAAPVLANEPLVSLLVPARNEARRLRPCLASLSAQRYGALEILVIDDQSTDGTAEILAAAAAADSRIRPLRVAHLPAGWIGKSFALDLGVRAARGEWLCFTDADTVHAPESVRRAVGFAAGRGLALLSLASRQQMVSFWERVIQPVVFGLLDQWFPLARVNDPASPLAAANGIFILVRREAYEAAGGHRAVRDEILEDVALARRVKAGGGRIAFADGADLVTARMYESFAAIREGWTKNLYALRDRRPARALGSAAQLLLTAVWPAVALAGFLSAGHAAAGAGAAVALAAVVAAEVPFRRRRGFDPLFSPTFPLGALVVAGFLIESALRHWLGGGIRWKGRVYTGRGDG